MLVSSSPSVPSVLSFPTPNPMDATETPVNQKDASSHSRGHNRAIYEAPGSHLAIVEPAFLKPRPIAPGRSQRLHCQ